MKKYWVYLLVFPMALIIACTAPKQAVVPKTAQAETVQIEISPTPASFADLLADALRHYEAGDYEEAILYYEMVLEIEPKSFDAQLGLGQSYRKNRQSDKAIGPLKAALDLQPESKPAAIALGYACLDTGEYAETKKLAMELLGGRISDMNAPSMIPLPEGDAPVSVTPLSAEEGEALALLLLSLGGQEKTEALQMLLLDTGLLSYLNETMSEHFDEFVARDGTLAYYVGQYDVNGQRDGRGMGIYGEFIYIGEYRKDMRSGHGTWCSPHYYFSGEWADDAPNGYGELIMNRKEWMEAGNYMNGLEHGEMHHSILTGENCMLPHAYQAEHGRRFAIDEQGFYILCDHVDPGSTYGCDLEHLWGVPGGAWLYY